MKNIKAVYALMGIVAIILSTFGTPCKVQALNMDYLDESKWSTHDGINTQPLNKRSGENSLEGVYKYKLDNKSNCMYVYFSITETSIDEENEIVKIHFDIDTQEEKYVFSVDENGICDCLAEEKEQFNVYSNMKTYGESKSGLYIAAVEIKEKSERNNIKVSLYINGHNYIIAKNIVMESEVTVSDYVETKESRTSSKSEKTTTKKITSTTKGKSVEKSTTERTTKFSPQITQGNTTRGKYSYAVEEESVITENALQETTEMTEIYEEEIHTEEEVRKEQKMTESSKAILTASIVTAALGLSFTTAGILSKRKKLNDK